MCTGAGCAHLVVPGGWLLGRFLVVGARVGVTAVPNCPTGMARPKVLHLHRRERVCKSVCRSRHAYLLRCIFPPQVGLPPVLQEFLGKPVDEPTGLHMPSFFLQGVCGTGENAGTPPTKVRTGVQELRPDLLVLVLRTPVGVGHERAKLGWVGVGCGADGEGVGGWMVPAALTLATRNGT